MNLPVPFAKDSPFERSKKISIMVMALIAMSLIDVGAGILYKTFTGHPWSERVQRIAHSRERAFRRSSPIFHHGLRESRSVKDARWGNRVYEVKTDSLGFKSRWVRTVSLTTDKPRLLFMGDSFTEGIGVEYPSTFVGLVEDRLAGQVEVLNAAASSYSPIIYWRKIKYLLEDVGLRFDEVIVYIDITDAFDEARLYQLDANGNVVDRTPAKGLAQSARYSTSSIRDVVKNNTIFFYLAYSQVRYVGRKVLGGQPTLDTIYLGSEPNLWTVDSKIMKAWGNDGLISMTHNMEKLLALLREKQIKLTVAVYPHPQQIIHNDLQSIQVTHWKSWCEKNGVSFINHFPSFFQTDGRPEEIIQRYFIEGDVHWNEAGHHLIAETFLAVRGAQRDK